jgi:3'-phosphoadenosine 5'-phosphosulfate sulfotransferase (PAPS reductase)/FAD synthetase
MRVKILVSFSGGKDSQACLIKAANDYGVDNIEAVFCDTGWEHPDTYKHIEDVCKQMNVRLTILKPKYDFISLAVHKKRFPSTKARFCTEELKIKPMIDYILSFESSCIIIQGIRASESRSRSLMESECMYFKGYFPKNKEDKKYYYRRKDVIEWCKTHDASVLRPIFNWSAQEVINYILENNQHPNPLYYRGFSRVGCFPCIMCRHQEIKNISNDEWATNRLIDAEKYVGSGFFSRGYIPDRFCKNRNYPTVEDVVKYVNRNDVGMDNLFDEDISCMSMYHGLCE